MDPKKESEVQITLKDSYGNASVVAFRIKPMPVAKEVRTLEPMPSSNLYSDIFENTLIISGKPCLDTAKKALMYAKGKTISVEPAYGNVNREVYLIDLRKNIPDSLSICGKTVLPDIDTVVPFGRHYTYYSDKMTVEFPEGALFDTLYLSTNYRKNADGSETFSIGERTVPLNKNINVSIKATTSLPWDDTYGVYRKVGRGYSYLGGKVENGSVHFSTREFGDFTVLRDVTPPSIRVVQADRIGVRFKISDNLSGINSYEANINGQWLLMHYDSKTASIWSEKLDKKAPLVGNFQLVVTDNAGNQKVYAKKIP